METTAQSEDKDIAEELLRFFVDSGEKECFAALLFTCYDLIKPDVALEVQLLCPSSASRHVCSLLFDRLIIRCTVRPPTVPNGELHAGGVAVGPHGLRVPVPRPVPPRVHRQGKHPRQP